MQIHTNTLIAECSAYDFKEMLERKKVKSWLKSVSAFANTDGGSVFYGVNDDGVIVGSCILHFHSQLVHMRYVSHPDNSNKV